LKNQITFGFVIIFGIFLKHQKYSESNYRMFQKNCTRFHAP